MRFKKGSKVEVLMRNDVPSGVWRVGEIVSGNGHTYVVRYCYPSGMSSKDVVGRVSRRDLRPCPPLVDGPDSWRTGDLVEVFDDMSWKTAVVSKILSRTCYLIRFVGSSRELQVNKTSIRVCQLWQDGNWTVMRKGYAHFDDLKLNKFSALSCYQKMSSPMPGTDARTMVESGESCLAVEKNAGYQESCVVSARTLKRASVFGSSDAEACCGRPHKIRAIEREGEHQGYLSSYMNKVDAVAYPREYLGQTYMHSPPNNHVDGCHDAETAIAGCYVESFQARSLGPENTSSDACSVGSCSVISNSPCEPYSRMLAGNSPELDIFSDAESFYGRGDVEENGYLLLGGDVAARIHMLELHAYRCTLEALYASGPLSWEQEGLLTNLRISLNVSNDEHLMLLRNLISSSTKTSMHNS